MGFHVAEDRGGHLHAPLAGVGLGRAESAPAAHLWGVLIHDHKLMEQVDVVAPEGEEFTWPQPSESRQEDQDPQPAGTGLLPGGVNLDHGGGQLQYDFGRHKRTLRGVPLAGAADLTGVAYEQLVGDGGVEHGPQQAVRLGGLVVSAAIDDLREPVPHVGSSDGSQSGRAKGGEDVSPKQTLVLVSSARGQRAPLDQTGVEPRLHIVGEELLGAPVVGGKPFACIGLDPETVVTSLGFGGKRTRVPLHPATAGTGAHQETRQVGPFDDVRFSIEAIALPLRAPTERSGRGELPVHEGVDVLDGE